VQELIEWLAAELLTVEDGVVNDSSKMDIAMATTHNQYFT
jgi:hypothetical protein